MSFSVVETWCVYYRTEPASSVQTEHRAVAGVDFIAESSSVDMLDGAVRAAVHVTILPVSTHYLFPRSLKKLEATLDTCLTVYEFSRSGSSRKFLGVGWQLEGVNY